MAATAPASTAVAVTTSTASKKLSNAVRVPACEYEFELASPKRTRTRFKGMDGVVFDVFDEAACVSGSMAAVIRSKDPSMPPDYAYPLSNVQSGVLETVLEYCYFHASTTRASISDDEADEWDDEFASLDPRHLCELASAAYYLDIKALVDLTCKTIAGMISGKSADEIRSTFHIENDLDGDFLGILPSEWYASGQARGNRLRTRLLTVERQARKLNKTRALRCAEKVVDEAENEPIATASVEEIMNYIDGGKPSGNQKASGKRRRGKKKRAQSPDRGGESQNGASKSRENSTPPTGSDTASPPATPPKRPPAVQTPVEEDVESMQLNHNTKDEALVTSPTTPEPKREEPSTSTPIAPCAAPAESRSSKRARQRARKKDRKRAAAASEGLDRASTEESTASHESNGTPQNFADEFDAEALHHMDEEVEAFARKLILADVEANEKKRRTLDMQLKELKDRASTIDGQMAALSKERESVRDKLARVQIELSNIPSTSSEALSGRFPSL